MGIVGFLIRIGETLSHCSPGIMICDAIAGAAPVSINTWSNAPGSFR